MVQYCGGSKDGFPEAFIFGDVVPNDGENLPELMLNGITKEEALQRYPYKCKVKLNYEHIIEELNKKYADKISGPKIGKHYLYNWNEDYYGQLNKYHWSSNYNWMLLEEFTLYYYPTLKKWATFLTTSIPYSTSLSSSNKLNIIIPVHNIEEPNSGNVPQISNININCGEAENHAIEIELDQKNFEKFIEVGKAVIFSHTKAYMENKELQEYLSQNGLDSIYTYTCDIKLNTEKIEEYFNSLYGNHQFYFGKNTIKLYYNSINNKWYDDYYVDYEGILPFSFDFNINVSESGSSEYSKYGAYKVIHEYYAKDEDKNISLEDKVISNVISNIEVGKIVGISNENVTVDIEVDKELKHMINGVEYNYEYLENSGNIVIEENEEKDITIKYIRDISDEKEEINNNIDTSDINVFVYAVIFIVSVVIIAVLIIFIGKKNK